MITGLPGEGEAEFDELCEFLQEQKLERVGAFPFSPEDGTPAAEMTEQISPEVKKARFARLLEVQNQIANEINQTMVGKRVRVLCDGESKNNAAVYSARTEANKIVLFDGEPSDTGTFLNLTIERADTFALYGKK